MFDEEHTDRASARPGEHRELVSTGSLPDRDEVEKAVAQAHERYAGIDTGTVSEHIPELSDADPSLFAICVVGSDDALRVQAGDTGAEFSIQSIAKAFSFAVLCDAIGAEDARKHLGVNSTGLPFNSVMAVELNDQRTMNPMVNAGALATVSLIPGESADERWTTLHDGLCRFAGRELTVDERVYSSESSANGRNRGISHLLASYGHVHGDPDEATDLHTRLSSLQVTVADLAVMGATLGGGGVNPVTGEQVVSADTCRRVLAIMATAGLYELSGDWLYEVGLPGKSGISGGLVTVSPGKGGLAVYSPPLDEAGNSVRGQLVTRWLAERLGLNLFASRAGE